MTAKDKAEELVGKFDKLDKKDSLEPTQDFYFHDSKGCALIAVDLIIKEYEDIKNMGEGDDQLTFSLLLTYWQAVKTELENLP